MAGVQVMNVLCLDLSATYKEKIDHPFVIF